MPHTLEGSKIRPYTFFLFFYHKESMEGRLRRERLYVSIDRLKR